MNAIDLRIVQQLCNDDTMLLTKHAAIRCRERRIYFDDIKHAIKSGEIIEQYPSDYPYPSCLILGVTINGKPLHVVCAPVDDMLWIITAYYPDTNTFENDFKTRKAAK